MGKTTKPNGMANWDVSIHFLNFIGVTEIVRISGTLGVVIIIAIIASVSGIVIFTAIGVKLFVSGALRMCYLQPGLVQSQGDTYVCLC